MNNEEIKSSFWKFSSSERLEEPSFNGALEKFYKLGVSGLVRENIQNSLDAKLQQIDEPVIVEIKTGVIDTNVIPGLDDIKDRINNLKGYNKYTNESIDHMKKSVNKQQVNFISFEDSNTKGLTGAENGENHSEEDTWGIYAYKKGVHSIDSNDELEDKRGGSHGIGKIASNAASDIFMMFFANCDDEGNMHLGGTVQLIEHEYNSNFYRSTGYFTDEDFEEKYIPYKNNFHEVFSKRKRGLKIVIPFLRDEFNSEKEIIKSVCDSFFIGILEEKLIVKVNNNTLDKENIISYINSQEYYEQKVSEIKRDFTPLYLNTYLNISPFNIEIKSEKNLYNFKLYFQIDPEIRKGRLAIIRTVGMKIEDKKVKNNANKPFNAILIPSSTKEDKFLKFLENQSHTELSYEHIKDGAIKKDARRFINNISNKISEIIDKKIREINPAEGKINTDDLIYTTESKFKRDLEKALSTVKINNIDGKKRQIIKSTGNKKEVNLKNDENEKKQKKKKLRREVDLTDREKNNSREKRYSVNYESVERVIIKDKEYIKLDLSNSEAEKKKDCDINVVIVDGMGNECPGEFVISDNYVDVIDKNNNSKCNIENNSIKSVSIENGIINIQANLKSKSNKSLKFVYYVEV